MSDVPMVEFQNLDVHYGTVQALHRINAAPGAGALGLLGPNGAGKTTIFRTVMGFIKPSSGACLVKGRPVSRHPLEIRRLIGYMPETDNFIPGMNAVSYLVYAGQLSGMPRADVLQRAHEILFYVGLDEVRYRLLDTYSTGMKQRPKLAQALIHGPKLLLLDEPTSGMDPQGRLEILELIRSLAELKGLDLILSSHVLPDVEQVCNEVIVINQGRIEAAGTVDELRAASGLTFDLRLKGDRERCRERIEALGGRCRIHPDHGDRLRVQLCEGLRPLELFRIAAAEGWQIRGLVPARSTLEDVYLKAMQGVPPADGRPVPTAAAPPAGEGR